MTAGSNRWPDLGVYASSKAAVSTYTESLANAFINEGTKLRAAVFYPGGNGLLETRLWNSRRNRPADLAAGASPRRPAVGLPGTQEADGRSRACKVADLVELGHSVLDSLREGKFIIQLNTESSGDLMMQRAEKIGRGELPTIKRGGAFE